jgi:hypothetical protein
VLVVVALVGGVPVPVVDIVDVVAVRDSVVATAGPVSMVVIVVGHVRRRVLVVVALMGRVRVTIVNVVSMALVLEAHVPAAGTVLMRVLGMDFVDVGSHGSSSAQPRDQAYQRPRRVGALGVAAPRVSWRHRSPAPGAPGGRGSA